jgi:pimeloyl-ACP methyl ester carboxylesterase
MNRLIVAALLLPFSSATSGAQTPPTQPAKGPGGAEYTVATGDIVKKAYGSGDGQVFVIRPSKKGVQPRPVIVFLHAYGAMSPRIYGAWIDHLVRHGHIVIYPRMQATNRTQRPDLTKNAAAALASVLTALKSDEPQDADLSRLFYVGHSSGGVVAANLAAMGPAAGLPPARLLFLATPGNSWASGRNKTPLVALDTTPEDMLVVALVASGDNIARETDARKILRETVRVPVANKVLVKMSTDDHGRPTLLANHNAATGLNLDYDQTRFTIVAPPKVDPPAPAPTPGRRGQRAAPPPKPPVTDDPAIPEQDFGGATVNALDWYGFWKILDLAMAAAQSGKDASAIKTAPQLGDMGQWGDGWPVKRMSFESVRPPEEKPAGAEAAKPPKRR